MCRFRFDADRGVTATAFIVLKAQRCQSRIFPGLRAAPGPTRRAGGT
jgi:hypothetical protein